jgi:hypothetical protein
MSPKPRLFFPVPFFTPLFVLFCLFHSFSAPFAEGETRFELGVDVFLNMEGLRDTEKAASDDTAAEGDIGDDNVFTFMLRVSPVWPLPTAGLYYQTGGEHMRIGFGAKLYTVLLASVIIPSVFAEFDIGPVVLGLHAGIMPIFVVLSSFPTAFTDVAGVSASAWLGITEIMSLGVSAFSLFDLRNETASDIGFLLCVRWTPAKP